MVDTSARPGQKGTRNEYCEDIAITGHGHIDGNRTMLDLEGYYKQMVSLKAWRPITGNSRISRVRLTNISSDQPARCVLTGRNAEYGIDDVQLSRITVAGRTMGLPDMEVNPFVREVRV